MTTFLLYPPGHLARGITTEAFTTQISATSARARPFTQPFARQTEGAVTAAPLTVDIDAHADTPPETIAAALRNVLADTLPGVAELEHTHVSDAFDADSADLTSITTPGIYTLHVDYPTRLGNTAPVTSVTHGTIIAPAVIGNHALGEVTTTVHFCVPEHTDTYTSSAWEAYAAASTRDAQVAALDAQLREDPYFFTAVRAIANRIAHAGTSRYSAVYDDADVSAADPRSECDIVLELYPGGSFSLNARRRITLAELASALFSLATPDTWFYGHDELLCGAYAAGAQIMIAQQRMRLGSGKLTAIEMATHLAYERAAQ